MRLEPAALVESPAEAGVPVPAPESRTTSTQIGKAIEALVASSLMLASKGRLSPFVPFADDDGLDLLLLDKLTGRTIPMQVKGSMHFSQMGSLMMFGGRYAPIVLKNSVVERTQVH